jgi:serine/threonine protein phosphatase PrpC
MKTLWCVHTAPTIVCDVSISSAQYQIFGVFDGHGGKKAAHFAEAHLPQVVSEELTTDAFDPGDCLIRAFERTDQQFIEACDVRNST